MTALPPKSELDGSSVGHNQGVFKAAVGGVRDFLSGLFGSTGTREDAIDNLRVLDPAAIFNLSLVPTVGANALTVNVMTRAGAAPSATDPVMISQRSVTAGAGDFNLRKITAALALTISSGSTLGHGNSDSRYIYWYLIDNAGAQELAASSKFFGLSGIVSTTAEGGAGAADSATVMYSTTARSNVPFRCIGRMQAPQSVAGTWTSLPTLIDLNLASDDAVPAENSYIQGVFGLAGDISPAQITSNQNDYNPAGLSTASVLRLSSDASRDINGIAGGADGRILTLINIGAFPINLTNENAGSAAANRFALPKSFSILGMQAAIIQYDSTLARWRAICEPSIAQSPTSLSRNLKVTGSNVATVPLTADAIVLKDVHGNVMLIDSLNITLNMATSGAGGLDTGAEASSTWYYVWAIARPDGTKSAVFSTSPSAPTLPSGYIFYALVSAVYNDSSSNFTLYEQRGNHVWFRDPVSCLSAGTATTETQITLAAGSVPTIAASFDIYAEAQQTDTSVDGYASFRFLTGREMFRLTVGQNSAGNRNFNSAVVEIPYVSGNLYYLWNTTTTGRGLNVSVTGYRLPIGGV